jgi:hypothetical protein
MEMGRVFFEVRTAFLNIILKSFGFKGLSRFSCYKVFQNSIQILHCDLSLH